MTTALPTHDVPAWLPTRAIPIQRAGAPVSTLPEQPTTARPVAPRVTVVLHPLPAQAGRPGSARVGRDGPAEVGRGPVPPAPTHPGPAHPGPAEPSRGAWAALGGLTAGLVVGAVAAMAAAVVPGSTADAITRHDATVPAPVRAANVSVPSRMLTAFGDGTWQVGVDIAPGAYATAGPSGAACYHALRASEAGGATDRSAVGRGPATVVLTPADGWFETFGCATWNRVG